MPDSYRFELTRETAVFDTIDLLTDLRVQVGSWREVRQGNRVVVTCTLAAFGEQSSIRTAVQGLEMFLDMAIRYASSNLETISAWFRWQTEGEPVKRSLIYSYRLEPLDDPVYDIHLESHAARWLLTFTRDYAYEEFEFQTASQNNVSTIGGGWDLTSTIVGGDEPGRIGALTVRPRNTGINLRKMWVGFRPYRGGVSAAEGFSPVIDFAASHIVGTTVGSTTRSGVSNSTSEASNTINGQHISDSFGGGTDLDFKLSHEFGSSFNAYVGRYLVLMRCKITAGSGVCMARVSTALSWPERKNPIGIGNTQYIENTAWRFVEMGEIELPGTRYVPTSFRSLRINIETGVASGTPTLGIDCLVLIPTDHYATWDKADFGLGGRAWIKTEPEGLVNGYSLSAPSGFLISEPVAAKAEIGGRDWGYPSTKSYLAVNIVNETGGYLVVAAERETVSNIADSVDLVIQVYRRWKSFRV